MLDLMLLFLAQHLKSHSFSCKLKPMLPERKRNPQETIRFKQSPSDSPVSSVLGPNNWLWLGSMISSSFLMFLLFLGIVTRYYIYPVERNSDDLYHWTFKVMWYMFLLCAGLCVLVQFFFGARDKTTWKVRKS